jgi:hypothetical protein
MTHRVITPHTFAALVAVGVLCLAAGPGAPERHVSEAVYPPQVIPLRFDHAQHQRQGLDCHYCHESVEASTRGADRNLPDEETCLTCHDAEAPDEPVAPGEAPGGCAVCHPGIAGTAPPGHDRPRPPPVDLPPPNLQSNHALHGRLGVACEECHGDFEAVGLAAREHLPRMADCLRCHDGTRASARCGTCHVTEHDDRLRTRFASGVLVPRSDIWGMAHGAGFAGAPHAEAARRSEKLCTTCHAREQCVDCHAGVRKPMRLHPGDFVHAHGILARGGGAQDCQSCHRAQSFCVSCHQRMGVAREFRGFTTRGPDGRLLDPALVRTMTNPAGRDASGNPVKFHPDGWVVGPRGSNHHAVSAQRDITSCASCHREETCLQCHSAREHGGTFSVRPHESFAGRCGPLRAKNERRCLKCHDRAALDAACRR